MPDFARHQTPAYVAREFDPADDTLGTDPRGPGDPEFAKLCTDLLVAAGRMHRCGRCAGAFWDRSKRDEHRARCER